MDGMILVSDGTSMSWQPLPTIPDPEPIAATTAKCPCCGSRQFVSHQSRRICTYCRSEQDGQPVEAERSIQQMKTEITKLSLDAMYGHSVVRPESVVRIAKL